MKSICSVGGCSCAVYARGICNKHWQRKYRRGVPLVTHREKFIANNPPKNGVGLIPLTQGAVAIVDDIDYPIVVKKTWALNRNDCTNYASEGGGGIRLHRFILGSPSGTKIDHIDHDGLNCRRNNMRETNNSGNMRNTRKHKDGSSRFKGVSWDKTHERWRAAIYFNGRNNPLISCKDEEEAACYYDVAAQILFGDFAFTNAQAKYENS